MNAAASAASQIEAWRHYSVGTWAHGQTPPLHAPLLRSAWAWLPHAPSIRLARALAALGDSSLPEEQSSESIREGRPATASGARASRLHSVADSTSSDHPGMAAAAGDVILSGFASIYFERVLKSVEETYSVR